MIINYENKTTYKCAECGDTHIGKWLVVIGRHRVWLCDGCLEDVTDRAYTALNPVEGLDAKVEFDLLQKILQKELKRLDLPQGNECRAQLTRLFADNPAGLLEYLQGQEATQQEREEFDCGYIQGADPGRVTVVGNPDNGYEVLLYRFLGPFRGVGEPLAEFEDVEEAKEFGYQHVAERR